MKKSILGILLLAALSAAVAYAAEGQLSEAHITVDYSACSGEGAGMCTITTTTEKSCTGGMQQSCTPTTVIRHDNGYCAPDPDPNGHGFTCN